MILSENYNPPKFINRMSNIIFHTKSNAFKTKEKCLDLLIYNGKTKDIGRVREVWCCMRHNKSTCDRANGKEHFPFSHSHYIVLPATNHPYV